MGRPTSVRRPEHAFQLVRRVGLTGRQVPTPRTEARHSLRLDQTCPLRLYRRSRELALRNVTSDRDDRLDGAGNAAFGNHPILDSPLARRSGAADVEGDHRTRGVRLPPCGVELLDGLDRYVEVLRALSDHLIARQSRDRRERTIHVQDAILGVVPDDEIGEVVEDGFHAVR